MKVFAISDLHLSTDCDKPMDIFGEAWQDYFERIKEDWEARVAPNDIVLLPGDLSWAMTMEQAMPDIALIAALKGNKVLLKGNHDYWWKSISKLRSVLPQGTYAVQNDCIRIDEFLICGTRGWLCPDDNGALPDDDMKIYLREAQRLKLSLEAMQRMRTEGDRVLCMMHYPPFNVKRSPSEFTKQIANANVDAVVYGHLHGTACRSDPIVKIGGVKYYITSCDIVKNKLVQIF